MAVALIKVADAQSVISTLRLVDYLLLCCIRITLELVLYNGNKSLNGICICRNFQTVKVTWNDAKVSSKCFWNPFYALLPLRRDEVGFVKELSQ